jgi:DNA-binding transcriptional MerR regulator
VELMTSGAFARASGLSRKALRLYDELGLLHPVQIDPVSQYRRYDPAQLEQARLVAWLRRLGVALARIRAISVLPRAQAAAEIAAYWQMLLRALGGGNAEPDLQLREARPGDRYLLCSDGLHDVVPAESIQRVLCTVSDPERAAKDLIALAIDGGGPDNITCIVADVVSADVPATA